MSERAVDISAILLIVACFTLIMCGHNGEVKSLLGVAIGYVFGKGFSAMKRGRV